MSPTPEVQFHTSTVSHSKYIGVEPSDSPPTSNNDENAIYTRDSLVGRLNMCVRVCASEGFMPTLSLPLSLSLSLSLSLALFLSLIVTLVVI